MSQNIELPALTSIKSIPVPQETWSQSSDPREGGSCPPILSATATDVYGLLLREDVCSGSVCLVSIIELASS
jgi:hypothetical protein